MVAKSDLDFKFLRDSPLFMGLGEEETGRLIELAKAHEFQAGQVIVEEGSMGDAIFLLYSGEISICTQDKAGREVILATLGDRGAFFGEIALADPGPRSATVRASSEAVLLEVNLEALEGFFAEFPEARVVILRNIARVLARRLRDSNVLVASISSS